MILSKKPLTRADMTMWMRDAANEDAMSYYLWRQTGNAATIECSTQVDPRLLLLLDGTFATHDAFY